MNHTALALPAPAAWRMATEFRVFGELGVSLASWPMLASFAPHGDGQPVLVLPGFLAGDASTYVTRRFLTSVGFDAYGWELGRNMGGIRRLRSAVAARLEDVYAKTGRRVSIVGWSLGGVFARDLALSHPEIVRYVVGLASPLTRDLLSANTGKMYARAAAEDADAGAPAGLLSAEFDELGNDLACPSTAMYSRCDGVVNWQTCLIRESTKSENLEVVGSSHVGFGINASALYAMADRLAQPDGAFTRFTPPAALRLAYGAERRTRDCA